MKLGSGGLERPPSAKLLTLVRVGRLLSDDRPVRGDPVALAEVSFEPFKKICPVAGADDENIAAVVLITFAAQITEGAQGVQGAGDDGLGHAKHLGEAADRMGPGRQIDHHQERHLPVGEVRLARPDIGDKRPHPTS